MVLSNRVTSSIYNYRQRYTYPLLFCTAATFIMILYYLIYVISNKGNMLPSIIAEKYAYNRGSLIFNYFNTGFVRRGLGGTFVALFGDTFTQSGLLFHFLSIIWLDVALFFLIYSVQRSCETNRLFYICLVTLLSPQTFIGWSTELIKTDIFIEGCIVWSMIFIIYRRPLCSAVVLTLGSLAHETAIIFGLPASLALIIQLNNSDDKFRKTLIAYIGVVLGIFTIVLVLQHVFAPSHEQMIDVLNHALSKWGNGPLKEGIEISSYFNIAGMRGLRTAICENANDRRFLINALFGIVLIAIYVPILLMEKRYIQFLLVALVPYTIMLCIATDTGRWLKFAITNACWIAICSLLQQQEQKLALSRIGLGICATLVLLVMGPTHFSVVNSLAEKAMNAMRLPPTGFGYAALEQCDNQWYSILKNP